MLMILLCPLFYTSVAATQRRHFYDPVVSFVRSPPFFHFAQRAKFCAKIFSFCLLFPLATREIKVTTTRMRASVDGPHFTIWLARNEHKEWERKRLLRRIFSQNFKSPSFSFVFFSASSCATAGSTIINQDDDAFGWFCTRNALLFVFVAAATWTCVCVCMSCIKERKKEENAAPN